MGSPKTSWWRRTHHRPSWTRNWGLRFESCRQKCFCCLHIANRFLVLWDCCFFCPVSLGLDLLLWDFFGWSQFLYCHVNWILATMAQRTRTHRAFRESSRSRDASHERQIPMWQPHPSTRGNEFRESWQEVPRPEQHRDILIFVCLRDIPNLMRQHHDNIMHWTSCDTLPLLGRQEEVALYTFSVLLTKERLQTFTVYNLLHMISRYIWTTWDRFLQPSSMDVRWSDETDDVFALREEDQLLDLLNFHRPHWTQGQEYGMIGRLLYPNEQIRRFTSPNQPYIMRVSCHEALPNRNMLPWEKTDFGVPMDLNSWFVPLSLHFHVSFFFNFALFLAPAVTWLNVTLLPLVSPQHPCRPMFIAASITHWPMPTPTRRINPLMPGHHTRPIHHHQLGPQLLSILNKIHHTNLSIQDKLHPTPLTPLINPQFSLSKTRLCQTGILWTMHCIHLGDNCMLTTSTKSVIPIRMTIILRNAPCWSRKWTDMESIGTANRSTSSMAS